MAFCNMPQAICDLLRRLHCRHQVKNRKYIVGPNPGTIVCIKPHGAGKPRRKQCYFTFALMHFDLECVALALTSGDVTVM